MRVINISLSELETKLLMIGFEGENQITQVRIDAAEILTDYPNATPTLIVKPLFGFAYPVIVTQEGTDVVWEIDNSVLNFHGDGEIQLTFTETPVIAKSYVGRIRIKRSLAVNGEKPDPIETWEQAATAKLAEVDAQIDELEDMVEAAEAAKDQAQDIVDDAAADIQAAGAAQVQVVQAAGEEVLDSIPSDYTELSDDVTGLKSAINSITETTIGKNLFNPATQTTGYISGGNIVDNNNWKTSDYIKVDSGKQYMLSAERNGTRVGVALNYLCTYDDTKIYVASGSMVATPYTVPSGVGYIRFSYEPAQYTDIQFEKGSAKTDYETHAETFSVITDKTLTQSNVPADAKAVGDAIKESTDNIESEIIELTDRTDCLTNGYSNITSDVTSGGVNLHDSTKDVSGYINSSGVIVPSTSYSTTQMIGVSPGDHLYCYTTTAAKSVWFRCFYDANGNPNGYANNGVSEFVVPESAYFVRISHQNVSGLIISANCIDISKPELKTVKTKLSEVANDKLKAITDFIGKNLVNMEECAKGCYIKANGDLAFSTSWGVTGFLPVVPGETYCASIYTVSTDTSGYDGLFFCEGYDANKENPSQVQNSGASTVTIPSGVYYVRYAFELPLDFDARKLQFEKGNALSSYEPYTVSYKFVGSDGLKTIWADKKWTCVGDSLTEVNGRTNKHYFDYVQEKTGISVVNMGVSGTGYARGDTSNFFTRIVNVPIDSDVITIFGSGNDIGASLELGTPSDSGTNPTTLCGYINGTIDKLFDFFPLANLGIVTPTPWVNYTPDIANNAMENYANAIVEICKRRSIPCLDLYHCSGLHPNSSAFREAAYSKDEGNGVHPDETGHAIIATRFEAFLDSMILR